jgi:hypothetical protein
LCEVNLIYKNLQKKLLQAYYLIVLSKALDNMATADRDLRQWELIDAEWNLLEQIKKLLNVIIYII